MTDVMKTIFMLFLLLSSCERNEDVVDKTRSKNKTNDLKDVTVAIYDISSLRKKVNLRRGFRHYMEEQGISLTGGERVSDSNPDAGIVILKLSQSNHNKVKALLDHAK